MTLSEIHEAVPTTTTTCAQIIHHVVIRLNTTCLNITGEAKAQALALACFLLKGQSVCVEDPQVHYTAPHCCASDIFQNYFMCSQNYIVVYINASNIMRQIIQRIIETVGLLHRLALLANNNMYIYYIHHTRDKVLSYSFLLCTFSVFLCRTPYCGSKWYITNTHLSAT